MVGRDVIELLRRHAVSKDLVYSAVQDMALAGLDGAALVLRTGQRINSYTSVHLSAMCPALILFTMSSSMIT
jgi:hypothetical protein